MIGWNTTTWAASTWDWISWASIPLVDLRIQFTDRLVGANHPNLADTLNRLFLVEHNIDGTHKQ
jgi:hypothetical protein